MGDTKTKCSSLPCDKTATHRVAWKHVDCCLEFCLEHLNMFLVDQVEVLSDLTSPWRLPENAQIILNNMVFQVGNQLEAGDLEGAGVSVGIAQAHVTSCGEEGLTLDTKALHIAEDALVKAGTDSDGATST